MLSKHYQDLRDLTSLAINSAIIFNYSHSPRVTQHLLEPPPEKAWS